MGLEVTTTIAGLNELWPLGGDNFNEIDDHIRLIKDVIKKICKGAAGSGFASSITATSSELSYASGLTSLLQTQLTGLTNKGIIKDGIIMYKGVFSAIPSNYFICDGTGGTVDLRNKFIYGTNTEANIGVTGGEDDTLNISHSHSYNHNHTVGATSTDGNHAHTVLYGAFGSGTPSGGATSGKTSLGTVNNTTNSGGSHSHNITVNNSTSSTSIDGVDGAGINRPAYYTLAYIQRKT